MRGTCIAPIFVERIIDLWKMIRNDGGANALIKDASNLIMIGSRGKPRANEIDSIHANTY